MHHLARTPSNSLEKSSPNSQKNIPILNYNFPPLLGVCRQSVGMRKYCADRYWTLGMDDDSHIQDVLVSVPIPFAGFSWTIAVFTYILRDLCVNQQHKHCQHQHIWALLISATLVCQLIWSRLSPTPDVSQTKTHAQVTPLQMETIVKVNDQDQFQWILVVQGSH